MKNSQAFLQPTAKACTSKPPSQPMETATPSVLVPMEKCERIEPGKPWMTIRFELLFRDSGSGGKINCLRMG